MWCSLFVYIALSSSKNKKKNHILYTVTKDFLIMLSLLHFCLSLTFLKNIVYEWEGNVTENIKEMYYAFFFFRKFGTLVCP